MNRRDIRFSECVGCTFNAVEPGICRLCVDGSEYEPCDFDTDDIDPAVLNIHPEIDMKEAVANE